MWFKFMLSSSYLQKKNVVSQSYDGKLIYNCPKKYSKQFIKIYTKETRVYISHHMIDDIFLFTGDTTKTNINLKPIVTLHH